MTGRAIVISLTFVGLLAGCDGSSGAAPTRFRFRTFNVSPCEQFSAEIDLEKAEAVLARLADHSPDCSLSAALQDCDALFEETSGGKKLHVTIANCDIPLNTGLFDCGFTQADVDGLETAIRSNCDCRYSPRCELNSVCDSTPPVCVNEENGVVGCESCNNGIDDNGNGKIDCSDEDCKRTEVCGWGWTTVTCTNTITVTTTLPPTTIPTVDGCEVFFRLSDAVKVGALSWDTTYSDGTFEGAFGNVECANLVDQGLASFSDVDPEKKLRSAVISLDGFTGPQDIAVCTFIASVAPVFSNFDIVVTEASAPDSSSIEPLPEVVVSSINCGLGLAGSSSPLQAAPTAD